MPPALPCPAPTFQWRMQASVLLFRWGSYCWACNLLVLIIYLFFLPVMLPSVFPRLTTDSAGRVFPGVWKPLFFYIFPYLFLKTMVCFSGCLMSSASLQKLFCGVCSALKCSFEEFVREKVIFPSYSSAIFPQLPCNEFSNGLLISSKSWSKLLMKMIYPFCISLSPQFLSFQASQFFGGAGAVLCTVDWGAASLASIHQTSFTQTPCEEL